MRRSTLLNHLSLEWGRYAKLRPKAEYACPEHRRKRCLVEIKGPLEDLSSKSVMVDSSPQSQENSHSSSNQNLHSTVFRVLDSDPLAQIRIP